MSKKVILIMTDTTRTDMLGCYGNPDMFTPNLDQMASEGIRFEKAYTTQPVCQPARSAIFTGTYPHSCAGWSNCMGLSDNVQSIGRRLTDHGVHGACTKRCLITCTTPGTLFADTTGKTAPGTAIRKTKHGTAA